MVTTSSNAGAAVALANSVIQSATKTQAQIVADRIKQLEAQTAGLFSNSLNRDNAAQLAAAKAKEQQKAIDYLATQAFTERQKQQFVETFGPTLGITPQGQAKTVNLTEHLSLSDGDSGGGSSGGSSAGGSGGAAGLQVTTDIFQEAIQKQVTQNVRTLKPEELTEAERKEIADIDAKVAALQERYDAWKIGDYDKAGLGDFRSLSSADRNAAIANFGPNLQKQMAPFLERKAAILGQTNASTILQDNLANTAKQLADLILTDGADATLKAAITKKMQEIDALITELTKAGVKLSTQALSDIGYLMNSARYKLQEESKASALSLEKIGSFLNDAIVRPAVQTGAAIGEGLAQFGDAFASALERSIIPTEDDIVANYNNQIKALQKIHNQNFDGRDIEAFNIEQVQKQIARGR